MNIYLIAKYFCLTMLLVYCTYTDLKSRIIENRAILAGLALGIVLAFFKLDTANIVSILTGVLVSSVMFFVMFFASKGGLGFGDVKLAIVISLFVGVYDFVNIMFYALVFTVIAGILLLVFKKKNKSTCMPFAPFMLAGCVSHILFMLIY